MKRKIVILLLTAAFMLFGWMQSAKDIAWNAVEAYADIYVEICPAVNSLSFDSAQTCVTVHSFQISSSGVCMVYSLEEGERMTEEMASCCPEAVLDDGTVIPAELTTFTESQGEIRMEGRFTSPVDLSQIVCIRFGRLCLPLSRS